MESLCYINFLCLAGVGRAEEVTLDMIQAARRKVKVLPSLVWT